MSSKIDEDGNNTWNHSFRIKGSSIFEGYGIINYYSNCISEEITDGTQYPLLSANPEKLEENLNGINEGQIITTIVEGVRNQTQDLLNRFELVLNREHTIISREASLFERERVIKEKEISLQDKEKKIALTIENGKNNAYYEVKLNFFRDNIDSYPLPECLSMINELQKLGEKIAKDSTTVNNEIWYWKLVRYFVQKKELQLASNLIFEQLANKEYLVLPQTDHIITVIRDLGLEHQFLEAVRRRIETLRPKVETVLELRNICRQLGLESYLQKFLN